MHPDHDAPSAFAVESLHGDGRLILDAKHGRRRGRTVHVARELEAEMLDLVVNGSP